MGVPILVGGCLIPVASQATSRGSKLFWIHFASTQPPPPAEDAAAGGRGRRGTRMSLAIFLSHFMFQPLFSKMRFGIGFRAPAAFWSLLWGLREISTKLLRSFREAFAKLLRSFYEASMRLLRSFYEASTELL